MVTAQEVLTFAAFGAVMFVLGIFFDAYMWRAPMPSWLDPEPARARPAEPAPQLIAVGTRRVRACPPREAVDDACKPSRPVH